MVGPEYKFLLVDVGMNGRNSDGGNWSQSCLKNGLPWFTTLNLPDPTLFHGQNYPLPYVCMGDDDCIHDKTLYSKKLEIREAHIQLTTFKNEMHIRKHIWHPC